MHDSLDAHQTSAKKRKLTVKVTDSPPSAKKQKPAHHISESEEESDIEEYDTEGEISDHSSDAEDSDVDEIMKKVKKTKDKSTNKDVSSKEATCGKNSAKY